MGVLVGHSFALLHASPPTVLGVGVHVFGLYIFFALSGYLVSASLERDRNPIRFLAKRCLRLFPGLWVCLTLILIAFALTSSLGFMPFLSHELTRQYLWNYLLNPRFALPEVFTTNPFPYAVQGSIWSLPVEASAYLALLALSIFGRAGAAIGLTLAVAAKLLVPPSVGELVFWGMRIDTTYDLAILFAVGSCLSTYRMVLRRDLGVAFAGLVVAVFATGTTVGTWVMLVTLPYAIVTFGQQPSKLSDWVTAHFGDLSYGIYLYSFPVQQALIALGLLTPTPLTLAATPITMILAATSWRFIEKPALRFKPTGTVGRAPASQGESAATAKESEPVLLR